MINAYESLKLAAKRPGAPLCGNRVWTADSAVIAERNDSTHTTERLFSLGEPAAYVNVKHGGHRVEVSVENGARERAFELRGGQWVETQDTAVTPDGGTFLSTVGFSHDLDSALLFRSWNPAPDTADVEQSIIDYGTHTQAVLDTIRVPLAQFTGTACVQMSYEGVCEAFQFTGAKERVDAEVAFPPVGGRVLVAVTYYVTRDAGLGQWAICP